jgi:hypothetical protein
VWSWRRRLRASPKPDYNKIRQLEIELGIKDPPVVTSGVFTQEKWFEICRKHSAFEGEKY